MQWNRIAWLCNLGAIGLLVVACKPSVPIDAAGEITLTYEGLQNDGMSVTDVFFILENRSTRAISFQGSKAFWSSTAYPVYTGMECTSADPHPGSSSSGFPLVDIWGGPPPYIDLSPGDRLRLNVADRGNDIARHRGDLCHLQLLLMGNEVIESKPFRPAVKF
jgi:hypothetical protein